MDNKKLLTICVWAAMLTIPLAGCSDYDNGYTEGAIKFNQDFRAEFGNIDPQQDWNLAERGKVTVTTERTSDIEIYALKGQEYVIVGHYVDVKGTRILGFDMVEGTTDIMVSDGRTAITTTSGGSANFVGTRYTHENYDTSGGKVVISKLRDEVTTINDEDYPKYYYTTQESFDEIIARVPERVANLNRVTHDFSYVSQGSFIIYPFYWNTSSVNTIGIYYTDANGTPHEQDIYTSKSSNPGEDNEVMTQTNTNTSYTLNNNPSGSWGAKVWPDGWTFNGNPTNATDLPKFHYNTWSSERDAYFTNNFIEYWMNPGTPLPAAKMERVIRTIEGDALLPGEEVEVSVRVRLMDEKNNSSSPSGASFYVNNTSFAIANGQNGLQLSNDASGSRYVYGTITTTATVKEDGTLTIGFNVGNNSVGNWLAFRDLTITRHIGWQTTDGLDNFSKNSRGQGIRVDIPEGTKFGMYLRKTDGSGSGARTYTFYSESAKNIPSIVGSGVTVDASGNKTQAPGTHPCYASTFYVGEQLFIGFEDWPNNGNPPQSDFDLNDLLLAFDGCPPAIIRKTPDQWLLACEDLGGTFDIDFNDIVFAVEHLSGEKTAIVTPLAAGGTLASYLFFQDPSDRNARIQSLGEIHQILGDENAVSGEYTPKNVFGDRGMSGAPIPIDVGENWSLAYYNAPTWHSDGSVDYGYGVNMGGFEIRVLESGQSLEAAMPTPGEVSSIPSTSIAGPTLGEAPYIICLPFSYAVEEGDKINTYQWAWPVELQPICSMSAGEGYSNQNGPYPEFKNWVTDHTTNGDWYKHRDPSLGRTVNVYLLSSKNK